MQIRDTGYSKAGSRCKCVCWAWRPVAACNSQEPCLAARLLNFRFGDLDSVLGTMTLRADSLGKQRYSQPPRLCGVAVITHLEGVLLRSPQATWQISPHSSRKGHGPEFMPSNANNVGLNHCNQPFGAASDNQHGKMHALRPLPGW